MTAGTGAATLQRPEPDPEADLVATLRELRAEGRFTRAAALVREQAARPGLGPAVHAAAARALSAVSDYGTARAHLALAGDDPEHAAAALAGLADLAWIEHDHERGRELARAGLSIDPSHRGCRTQLQRNERAIADAARPGARTISHAAFFADPQGNSGDRALTEAVRRCFTGVAGVDGPEHPGWLGVHVHQLFDEARLAAVNATAGLVVGGGGLFLPDTAPNGNSGWQWNVPDAVLARIEVPLVVFGVGYNMFAGQTFDADGPGDANGAGGAGAPRGIRFVESLRTLVERAAFVGLRNHGSIERVRELLPAELAERVVWQPCPTTVGDLLTGTGPDAVPDRTEPADGTGAVLLNCAYDRAGRRFGDRYGDFLEAMRDWVQHTRERAEVRFAAHCVDDERFVSDLRREHGVTLPVVRMYDLTADEMNAHYRRAALAVGMRGHAGMIPFGVGTPIASLVSHPKLGYFLRDLDRPHWGIGVQDADLGPRLRELTTTILDDLPAARADVAALRAGLATVTAANLAALPAALRPPVRIGQDAAGE